MSRRKSGLLLAGAALLLGFATACSASEPGSLASNVAGEAAPAPNAAADSGGAGSGGAPKQAAPPNRQGQQQPNAPVQERKLVQTARIEMTVKDPFEAISRARSVATENDGFTGQEDSSGDKATITLRIPADRFDKALEQLAKLGTTTVQNKKAEDVTEQVVDLDSRLATQRESVNRMQALLNRAQSIGEIAQIESELTRRQSDLESLQGRRDTLGGKVALSTVTLQVTKESVPAAVQAAAPVGGFTDGFSDGWKAFGEFFTGLSTVVGTLLPFLVALGVPAGLVFYFRRKRRKSAAPVTETP